MTGFDTTPKPAFIRALRNQKWTAAGALSELVDNSFGAGRGNASNVTITYDVVNKTMSVLDDGQGMESLGRLFQLGNTIGRTPDDIGEFGSGGTMALIWLADTIEIWSLRDGMVAHDRVNWIKQIKDENWPQISSDWKKATARNTPEPLIECDHGTLITLAISKERKILTNNIQRDLAETYAPASRLNKRLIWRTLSKRETEERVLGDPLILSSDRTKRVHFDLTLEVDGDHLGAYGEIGIIDGLSHNQSCVSIGYGARVIMRTRECYHSDDERYIGTGVAGYLQLKNGWQPYLTTTKDGLNNQPAFEALMAHVFKEIRPLLEQVKEEKTILVFNEIALELQDAFNADKQLNVVRRGHLVLVDEGGTTVTVEPGPGPQPEPNPNPLKPAIVDPDDDAQEQRDKKPAISSLCIIHETDQNMGGDLCRAQVLPPNDIAVTVNRDHPIIKKALEAEPINRMALIAMAVREVASELSYHPEIWRRLFPKTYHAEIESRDEQDRERYVTRLLIDKARA